MNADQKTQIRNLMRNRKARLTRQWAPSKIRVTGGPYDGCELLFEALSQPTTLPFTVYGQSGRYKDGKWEAA